MLTAHIAAAAVVIAAGVAGTVPWTATIGIAILGLAAAAALARPPVPARTVGWTQMVLGLVVVVTTAVGA